MSRKHLSKQLLFVLIFCALIFYAFQLENLTHANYLAGKYEKQIKTMDYENYLLEQSYFKDISIKDVEEKAEKFGFVRVGRIKYIPISNDYLVRETTIR